MKHIFDIWPSVAAMASDLEKPYTTVASWKQRNSIPADIDVRLIEAAKARGSDLGFEELARARSGEAAP